MVKIIILSAGVIFSCIFYTHAAAEENQSITIGLIGDSTVADTYGWGPAFASEDDDQVVVLNYAENGATLDSLSGRLDDLIAQSPHYVLIQFGHNDMHYYDASAYAQRLAAYVNRINVSGSTAVIVSPVTRREFNASGKLVPRIVNGNRSLPIFSQTAGAVAQDLSVPFVDLNTISMDHHNVIGPEASKAYNFRGSDVTHFSDEGARAIASLVTDELASVVPDLAEYFK